MEFIKLPCGIDLLYHWCKSPISYCGFAINNGTRDELPEEWGMAHFVEHMLFKGTTHRTSQQVIRQLENIGGQLDAYTEKEETFVYAVVPNRYTPRAIELLSDLVFHSTFPQNEIEKERDVIIDEIESYNDSPSELIYDDFEAILYPNHPIGRAILGQSSILETFTTEQMKAFVDRNYTHDRLLFFYAGRYPLDKLTQLCNSVMPVADTHNKQQRQTRQKPTAAHKVEKELIKSTSQAHCMIGYEALPLGHEQRFTLALLNNILGGPMMSSRFNMAIREKKALAYTVESSTTAYSDTGLWSVYWGCDHSDVTRTSQLITKEINQLCETPLSAVMLSRAKRQLLGQLLIASQNMENNILSMAKVALHQKINPETINTEEHIKQITSNDVLNLAQQIFNPNHIVKLLYV
ncbi:MAG: pitrilysin family protein [Bacteroidales bacterium]|nr:pitrilysin family protein [Bacteroidales bacterium]